MIDKQIELALLDIVAGIKEANKHNSSYKFSLADISISINHNDFNNTKSEIHIKTDLISKQK